MHGRGERHDGIERVLEGATVLASGTFGTTALRTLRMIQISSVWDLPMP
jgi:hypothetical protein